MSLKSSSPIGTLSCLWTEEEEIKADNAAMQEWNQAADMALITGISEETILEIKQTQIHEKVSQSIRNSG